MFNDEQRRKVAEELRSESEGWRDMFPDATPEGEGIDAAIMFDLIRFVGLDDESPVHAIYARLADLIDRPTCKIEGTYDDEYGIYDHLTCGHVAMRQWTEPTNYCPNCGAEVVE